MLLRGGGVDGGDLGVYGGEGGGHGFGGGEVGGEAEMGEDGAKVVGGGDFGGLGVACTEAAGDCLQLSTPLDELTAPVVVLGLGGEGFALGQDGGEVGFEGGTVEGPGREQGDKAREGLLQRGEVGRGNAGTGGGESDLEASRGEPRVGPEERGEQQRCGRVETGLVVSGELGQIKRDVVVGDGHVAEITSLVLELERLLPQLDRAGQVAPLPGDLREAAQALGPVDLRRSSSAGSTTAFVANLYLSSSARSASIDCRSRSSSRCSSSTVGR